MLYEFSIVSSVNTNEPGALYFASLERKAEGALSVHELSFEGANALCEYLDCVDAGDLKNNKLMYRQAVDSLCEYLAANEVGAAALALSKRSPAAKTLLTMARAANAKQFGVLCVSSN